MDMINELWIPGDVRYRHVRARVTKHRKGTGASRAQKASDQPVDMPVSTVDQFNALGQNNAGLAAWGYVYHLSTQTVAVGESLNFSNNGPLNGINHPSGGDRIQVAEAGTYNITFSVYTAQNNPQDWGVAVNGTVRSRFNSAGQTITGTTSLTLNANDTVTILNVDTSPDPATLRTGDFTTAYVLIYKVDSQTFNKSQGLYTV